MLHDDTHGFETHSHSTHRDLCQVARKQLGKDKRRRPRKMTEDLLIPGLSLSWWDEIHPLKWFPDIWANYSMSQKFFVNTTALLALNCQAQSADHHHPRPRHLLTCCMCECVCVWVTSSFTQLSLFKTECEQYDYGVCRPSQTCGVCVPLRFSNNFMTGRWKEAVKAAGISCTTLGLKTWQIWTWIFKIPAFFFFFPFQFHP